MSILRSFVFFLLAIVILIAPAQARRPYFEPGQWEIRGYGDTTQQICIVSDGSWYGTTYNWSGHWSYNTDKAVNTYKAVAVIFGNYAVNNEPFGYGNATMTISYFAGELAVDWEDWFDDESYTNYEPEDNWGKVKTRCDKPYTGANTQAPSQ